MICHQHKCIFIHIPKTAGTSIEHKLGHFQELHRGVQDHRTISEIEPVTFSELIRSVLSLNTSLFIHNLKKTIKDKQSNLSHIYSNYYKFSFVRNPWARVFSWYKNIMRDDHHKLFYNVNDNCTFKDFLKNHTNHRPLNSQLFWLVDKKGNIPFDFIGKFENLEDDFKYIGTKIGLKNIELPKLVAGDGQNYINFYDSEMIELINKKYKDEIDFFKFKFGE